MPKEIKFKDIFGSVDFHEDEVQIDVKVPNTFYHHFTDYFMERSYLNDVSEQSFARLKNDHSAVRWLKITHLPINPDNSSDYDILSRWQGVLSSLHAWGYRMIFLLYRHDGETNIYLGTASSKQSVSAKDAIEQIREAAFGAMPGIGLQKADADQIIEIMEGLSTMPSVGAVTGIPSFREENTIKQMQTLDSIAFGLQDEYGQERDYAVMVIADPLSDRDIANLIRHHRELSTRIHSDISLSTSEGRQVTDSGETGVGGYSATMIGGKAGGFIGGILGSFLGVPSIGSTVGELIGMGLGGAGAKKEKKISFTTTGSLNREYLDKFAQYAEELIEKHINRLNEGRNLGFWNTGVYVLGDAKDIRTVEGMLRSVYSGKETYLEPIRIHNFYEGSGAKEITTGFDLIPLVDKGYAAQEEYRIRDEEWHIFGKPYQYVSTPMNTAELSLATSLPRRDVPGLRFVKTAVRFASNPAEKNTDTIYLGQIVDMGVQQTMPYYMDPNALVRHTFITGITGSGKSTTCKVLLNGVASRNIPFLIIEPAKDDYVRWAVEMNKTLPEDQKIQIYMPGGENRFPDVRPLRLNLFQPAAPKGESVNLLSHSENLSMLLNACLPSEDVIPILIDETVNHVVMAFSRGRDEECFPAEMFYPNADNLIQSVEAVMKEKGYEEKVLANMKEILYTRFKFLKRGTRGKILNTTKAVDFDELFSHPAVINISGLAGSKEKSLIMSLLLLAIYEYRTAIYNSSNAYREEAQKNKLMHLTLIEEAHNVLAAPPKGISGSDPRAAASDLFSNIISEIRFTGEGLAIVDQTPVKVLPDIIKNTNLKICHRLVAEDDSAAMAASLALRDDQKTLIPALEIGNVIVCGDMDDAATWVKIPAPTERKEA